MGDSLSPARYRVVTSGSVMRNNAMRREIGDRAEGKLDMVVDERKVESLPVSIEDRSIVGPLTED